MFDNNDGSGDTNLQDQNVGDETNTNVELQAEDQETQSDEGQKLQPSDGEVNNETPMGTENTGAVDNQSYQDVLSQLEKAKGQIEVMNKRITDKDIYIDEQHIREQTLLDQIADLSERIKALYQFFSGSYDNVNQEVFEKVKAWFNSSLGEMADKGAIARLDWARSKLGKLSDEEAKCIQEHIDKSGLTKDIILSMPPTSLFTNFKNALDAHRYSKSQTGNDMTNTNSIGQGNSTSDANSLLLAKVQELENKLAQLAQKPEQVKKVIKPVTGKASSTKAKAVKTEPGVITGTVKV